jgi:hypothetical protein
MRFIIYFSLSAAPTARYPFANSVSATKTNKYEEERKQGRHVRNPKSSILVKHKVVQKPEGFTTRDPHPARMARDQQR